MAADTGKRGATSNADDLAAQIEAIRADMQNLTSTVKEIGTAQIGRAQDMAKETVGRAQDKAEETAQEAQEAIKRKPLQAVAIAAGLGFLFGVLTRR